MRKKIGFLIAAGATAALLHFAVPSADSAVSQVKEEAVQSCPAQKSCPATQSCPEGKSSCPMAGEKV